MEGEATLIDSSWTQKMVSNHGDMNLGAAAQLQGTSPTSGQMGVDAQGALAGLNSHHPHDPSAPASPDPSSVLLLQQNLHRLYGSLGQLSTGLGQSASRASLHSILEDQPEPTAGDGAPSTGMPRSASFLLNHARNTSEDDLFLMDGPSLGGSMNSIRSASAAAASAAAAAAQNASPPSGMANQGHSTGNGIVGESRTLFIRGIDPAMPDEVVQEYLECFGDIHSLYTASKHRGYVMVTYHDIRAACLAQNTVHAQTWRGSQMSCQFSADGGGSAAGGVTAALLLIALDGGPSLDDAFYMLSSYGELKELRREPNRPNIALIEYYDARHAEAALKGIQSSVELSKRLMAVDAGSSLTTVPQATVYSNDGSGAAAPPVVNSGSWGSLAGGATIQQQQQQQQQQQPVGMHDLAAMTQTMQGMSLQSGASGGSSGQGSHSGLSLGDRGGAASASADYLLGMSAVTNPRQAPMGTLRGVQSTGSLAMWPQQGQQLGTSPLGNNGGGWGVHGQGSGGTTTNSSHLQQDILVAQQQAAAVAVLQQNAALLQQQQQVAVQNAAVQAALQQAMLNQQVAAAALGLHHAGNNNNRGIDLSTMNLGARRGFSEPALGGRLARRPMDPHAEAERRAQQDRLYGLDMQRIAIGEDKRTTLMVKNIPNKYTQKMLLTLMEERFAGNVPFPFDFFYLPIDFKNRCNVGYAFINMTTPHAIPALVEEFHGRRWPKFNSEKICRVAYARIQGKDALVQHFQNSSLLHEDKRCRPVLFTLDGTVETFPVGGEGGPSL